ncbi:MAG: DUF1565 domain-containing protein, partial [Deltaproteobacteria bacterium]|nr:DUF1565 domain-containing protein [Deltaproteobacteria bacterium]
MLLCRLLSVLTVAAVSSGCAVGESPDAGGRDASGDVRPRDTGPGMCMMGATDEPDPANFDANCDGIDGDLAQAVFVADDGIDANTGTREQPVRTLTAAIERARSGRKTQILVSRGMYPLTETLVLESGVGIYGGYDRRNSWARGDNQVIVTGARIAVDARVLRNTTRIARIELRSADATMPGTASIALRAVDAPGLEILDGTVLTAGRGAAGANGMAGNPGGDGANGGAGGDGANDSQNRPGAGGAGGMNAMCTSSGGGAGGGGGRDPQFRGSDGSPAGLSGPGGMGGGTSGCTPAPGQPGQTPTADGVTGASGNGGAAQGSISMEGDYVGANGEPGRDGTAGSGGGGGGGSSGQTGALCVDGSGNG